MENKKFDKEKFNNDIEKIVNILKGRRYNESKILLEMVNKKLGILVLS